MRKIFTILLLLCMTVVIHAAKYAHYTVQSGDSLFLIAERYNTTTGTIRTINNMAHDALIRVGQTLSVPAKTKPSTTIKKQKKSIPKGKGTVEYAIQEADTLYIIARKHHTTIQELLDANGMEYDAMIRIGQKLTVPTNTYFPDKKTKKEKTKKREAKSEADTENSLPTYKVKGGDTLFGIALKHHMTLSEIIKLNDMNATSVIKVGQQLTISKKAAYITRKPKLITKLVDKIYTVKRSDTLTRIANRENTTVKSLRKRNKLRRGRALKIGQKLIVGKKEITVKATSKVDIVEYKIEEGDTPWSIANRHKISIKKLRELNDLTEESVLIVGRYLLVKKIKSKSETKPKRKSKTKSKTKSKKRTKKYRVKEGDTLWLIAKKHNTTVKTLREINGFKRGKKLYKGMIVKVDRSAKKRQGGAGKSKQRYGRNGEPIEESKKSKALFRGEKSTDREKGAMAIFNGKSKGKKRTSSSNQKVIQTAKRYLGTRYVWGAVGPNKFDCSGFTQFVMRKTKGVKIPRVSRKQAYYGKYVSRKNLRAGDLVFFDTSRRRKGYVNHVGIYIGNNKFIHASSGYHRVVITSLNKPFYRARFKWGRRVNK